MYLEKPMKTSENPATTKHLGGNSRMVVGIKINTNPSKLSAIPQVDGFECKLFINSDSMVIFTIESKKTPPLLELVDEAKSSAYKSIYESDSYRKYNEDQVMKLSQKAFAVLSIFGLLFQSGISSENSVPFAVPFFVKLEGFIDKFKSENDWIYGVYKNEPIQCHNSTKDGEYTFVGKNFSLIKLDCSNLKLPLFTDKKYLKKYAENITKFKEIKK